MLRRACVPVPLADSELRELTVRPVPVEPKAFSDTEIAVWSDKPVEPTLALGGRMTGFLLILGYGVLCAVAALLRLAIRALHAISRQCEESEDRVTLLGMLCVLGALLVARYAVYVAAFYMGGAR